MCTLSHHFWKKLAHKNLNTSKGIYRSFPGMQILAKKSAVDFNKQAVVAYWFVWMSNKKSIYEKMSAKAFDFSNNCDLKWRSMSYKLVLTWSERIAAMHVASLSVSTLVHQRYCWRMDIMFFNFIIKTLFSEWWWHVWKEESKNFKMSRKHSECYQNIITERDKQKIIESEQNHTSLKFSDQNFTQT